MHKLLVSLAVLSAVSAAGTTCKTGNVVNRLVSGRPYYFPATWNETMPAPELAKEQTCSWTVTIPQGYYARLIIDGTVRDKDSRFQIIDSVGNFIQTTHEEMDPYFFPPTKFTLAVSNEGVATFGFQIQWIAHNNTEMDFAFVGSLDHDLNVTSSVFCEGLGGAEGISLLAFPQNRKHPYSLRSTLVYEAAPNQQIGNFINNLYEMYLTKKQWISNVPSIVICNLEVSNNTDFLVVQSSVHTKNLNYVELVTVPGTKYNATVNSEKKTSALISASYYNQTMTDIQMDATSVISQYYGTPSGFTFDRNYTATEMKSALPMEYPGGAYTVQWVLNSGKAVFTFQA
ncbi:unnamed protein product [Caenorhabditis nigoni]